MLTLSPRFLLAPALASGLLLISCQQHENPDEHREGTYGTQGETRGSGMDATKVNKEVPDARGAKLAPGLNPPGIGNIDPLGTGGMLPGVNNTPTSAAPDTFGEASTQVARGLPESGGDRATAESNKPGAEATSDSAQPATELKAKSVHCPPTDPNAPATAQFGGDSRTAAADCAAGDPNDGTSRTGKPGNP